MEIRIDNYKVARQIINCLDKNGFTYLYDATMMEIKKDLTNINHSLKYKVKIYRDTKKFCILAKLK